MPSILTMMKILAIFANRNPEVVSSISGLESKMLVNVTDDSKPPFYLQSADGKLHVKNGVSSVEFDATMKSDKETLLQVISGKISQEDAFNRKLIETSGSISDAIRFRFVINKTIQGSRTLQMLQRFVFVTG